MTRNEILRRFPKATESFIRANLSDDFAAPAAKLEPNPCHAPLAKEKVQRPAGKRFLVRVTSFRRRLLDEDNLCSKYHVDLCRYASIIPGDSPDKCKIEVGQIKVGKSQTEKTVVEVFEF